jgi:hypothetical protein
MDQDFRGRRQTSETSCSTPPLVPIARLTAGARGSEDASSGTGVGTGNGEPGRSKPGQAMLGGGGHLTVVARLQSEAISVAMLRRVCRGSRSAAERARRKFFKS